MDVAIDMPLQAIGHSYGALFLSCFKSVAEERLVIAYFDGTGGLIDLHLSEGQRASISFPLRRIVQSALAADAAAVMLAHNHPSGDTRPSLADREMTRKLAAALRPLDIRLLDHLIFAGDEVAGFRALGLL
jgi:DNA repair protein RadC